MGNFGGIREIFQSFHSRQVNFDRIGLFSFLGKCKAEKDKNYHHKHKQKEAIHAAKLCEPQLLECSDLEKRLRRME